MFCDTKNDGKRLIRNEWVHALFLALMLPSAVVMIYGTIWAIENQKGFCALSVILGAGLAYFSYIEACQLIKELRRKHGLKKHRAAH